MKNPFQKIAEAVGEKRAEILDDFLKAYLASRADYFSKQKKIDLSRVELVEDHSDPNRIVWFFQLRKGRLKKAQIIKKRLKCFSERMRKIGKELNL